MKLKKFIIAITILTVSLSCSSELHDQVSWEEIVVASNPQKENLNFSPYFVVSDVKTMNKSFFFSKEDLDPSYDLGIYYAPEPETKCIATHKEILMLFKNVAFKEDRSKSYFSPQDKAPYEMWIKSSHSEIYVGSSWVVSNGKLYRTQSTLFDPHTTRQLQCK